MAIQTSSSCSYNNYVVMCSLLFENQKCIFIFEYFLFPNDLISQIGVGLSILFFGMLNMLRN